VTPPTDTAAATRLPLPTPAPRAATPPRSAWRTVAADYVELTKPRIMLLILVTGLGAMCFAADGWPGLRLTAATMAGLALSSGGAGALNHVLDRDLDARMRRTAGRPVPSGRVSATAGAAFATALLAGSAVVLGAAVNVLAAALALAGAFVYVVVYTAWLKRRTPQNIVWGGAAGAVPPLVGWAAVRGDVGLAAVYMFALIFLWTPPHFWSLALLAQDDYRAAGVPMLPVVRGDRATARQILAYTLLLAAVSVVPYLTGTFGIVYLASAVVLGGWFVLLAARLVRAATRPAARATFLYSLAYLALLFAAIGVDRVHLG
jgi:protoheme IX farnesyltransferase